LENQPPLPVNPYAPPAAAIEVIAPRSFLGDPLARPGTRFGARFIDQLLLLVSLIPGGILLATKNAVFGAVICALGALALCIYQWSLIVGSGQSLGKLWCKIKIVRTDGRPVDFISGVVTREWIMLVLRFVPAVGSILGLIDALFVFRVDRRCLHDHMAGTKVIEAS
jgi:uncharacterized RDD family membrane protein YckC